MKLNMKLSIIDDYIQIKLIKNFCNNDFSLFCNNICIDRINKTKEKCITLLNLYEQIINTLKLDDTSFLVLKQQLEINNSLYLKEQTSSFVNLSKLCDSFETTIDEILKNIKDKLTKLQIKKLIV